MQLQLITLNGVFIDKEVYEVAVPTMGGDIAINPGHNALVGAIRPGIMTIKYKKSDKKSDWQSLAVYEGTIEVLNNIVTVLVDDVDTPSEVNEAEAQKAYDRAKDLKAKAGDGVGLAEAQSMMDRQAVRLQLANLKRRKK